MQIFCFCQSCKWICKHENNNMHLLRLYKVTEVHSIWHNLQNDKADPENCTSQENSKCKKLKCKQYLLHHRECYTIFPISNKIQWFESWKDCMACSQINWSSLTCFDENRQLSTTVDLKMLQKIPYLSVIFFMLWSCSVVKVFFWRE